MRILVVEDDDLIAQALTKILSNENYAVEVAKDGQLGWELIETYEYDLVLLDVVLPKLDGITLCKKLRSHHYQMPVLLLTGRDSGHDKAVGLDAGADDYVVKPFDPEELAARIRALLRRGGAIAQPVLAWGELQLDPTTHEVTWRSQLLSLTSKEYALLELFLRNSRRVFSCGMILEHLWSYETMPGEEAVRTHIKCLRQKFKAVGIPTDLIETVYGIGYRLKPLEVGVGEGGVGVRAGQSSSNGSNPQPPTPNPQPPTPNTQQTLQAIARVWDRFKDRVSNQVAVLEQVVAASHEDAIAPDLWQQAEREAHTLAGALGTFGFPKGSQVARTIEHLLKAGQPLASDELDQLRQLVRMLRQDISQPPQNGLTAATGDERPLLFAVDRDRPLLNSIAAEAGSWGFRMGMATDLASAKEKIYRDRPDVVLLDLSFSNQAEDGLKLLTELSQQQPPIPTLIYTAQDGLAERLEAARLGGRSFLHKPLPVFQVLEAASQTLQQANAAKARVLVVDDDPSILSILKNLLKPWGLNVSGLDNPQQFWKTLEMVAPDLLILDVEMPHLSGIELCQIVRNDMRWNHLPILFLTAHTDAEVVNQVFAVGADDFVCKPIIGPELVTRIINRLDRIKLSQNLTELDPLTGLANRQKATHQINLFLSLAKRQSQSLCLAVLKLNEFKAMSDRYGHAVVDEGLRQVGTLLQESFRSDDILARWSNKEFVVAMYGTSRQEGTEKLNAVLKLLHQQGLKTPDGKPLKFSFSIGLACYPENGTDLQTLHTFADVAAYGEVEKSDRSSSKKSVLQSN
ncbi:MAG TPA: response regulator [Crinalium sp.]|jgi:diguanylate cyclase (GGDEF)-like protein